MSTTPPPLSTAEFVALLERIVRLEGRHEKTEQAIHLMNISVGNRLDGMNALRQQIESERGSYVSRELYDADKSITQEYARADGAKLEERLRKLETSEAIVAATRATYASAAAIAMALLSIFVHWLH